MSNTIDFMLSAFVSSSELWGCCFSVPEVESEPRPRYVPPPFPPQLAPPPLTPEQIKAQEKRARKAAKQAMQNQTVNSDSRAVAKLVNAGYPGGLRCPKQR
jgi:hypothetical protein